jgi:hypothetical protein
MVSLIKDHKKNAAGTMIQQYLKGMLVAQKYEPFYRDMRLKQTHDYFSEMKLHMHTTA